jgi:hypothetical protein
MKRKVKRYDEGGGIFDGIKEGLSKVFRKDDESKYSDLESVGGAGRRPKTIEEQIKGSGREERMAAMEGKEFAPYRREPAKDESRSSLPAYKEKSGTSAGIERDVMGVAEKPEKEAKPAKTIKEAAPKVEAKKPLGEEAKPLPAKPAAKKEEPKPLPGKPEPKSKVTPYSAPKKISKDEEAEGERGKRMEEEAAAQLKKNKEETKTAAPVKKGEYYRDFSGKLKKKTPDDRAPLKDLGETVSKGAKAVGSSISEYAKKNIKSPAQRRDEEKAAKEKKYAKGGSVSSASKRADGIAMRGKTRGRIY